LNPTDPIYGNSPYSSNSAFAGNTLLISPDRLFEEGLLSRGDLEPIPSFPSGRCDYGGATHYKARIFERAYQRFSKHKKKKESFEKFSFENSFWLEDFSLFVCLKELFGGQIWNEWPIELRDRDEAALRAIRLECAVNIEKVKFQQYLFFNQLASLKDYCQAKEIHPVGDLSIYPSFDSADVWANPGIFKLDSEKRPAFVSGVPPDYFSATGQLWGSPVYNWAVLQETGYKWWMDRIAHNARLFDILRIDHFRGLVAFWEIPAGEKSAVNGRWVDGPGTDFLNTIITHFPRLALVAEDLGTITQDVRGVMDHFNLPGMKILTFAFSEDDPNHPYLPHTYNEKCVVYTGTHDNNTVRGWFENESSPEERGRLFRYLGREVSVDEIHWEMIRLLMQSAARWVVFPMQDVLGLGEETRMNKPSVPLGNWEWRLFPNQLSEQLSDRLQEMTTASGRVSAS
jgi:4-alpha-glucanotransferase